MASDRKLVPMPPGRFPLIQVPTPMHRLDRISQTLGLDLWIKRDDLTGLAMGGNKGRKLEFLMADVLEQHAEIVVSCGAAQSNFVRQLGAACSMLGLRCVAAVMNLPYEDEPPPSPAPGVSSTGNVLLDELLGVDLRVYPDGTWEELYARAEDLAGEFEAAGKAVYRMPVGGSSPLGALAFYEAAGEVGDGFDAIVFASSSGSTHTGLAAAFAGTQTRVVGIACDPEPELAQDFAKIAVGLHALAPVAPALEAKDYELNFSYVGPGYGVPSEAGDAAILLLARTEGIFLDPIYTGKGFAGLLDLAERGELSGRVLFWHTGGLPALFA